MMPSILLSGLGCSGRLASTRRAAITLQKRGMRVITRLLVPTLQSNVVASYWVGSGRLNRTSNGKRAKTVEMTL